MLLNFLGCVKFRILNLNTDGTCRKSTQNQFPYIKWERKIEINKDKVEYLCQLVLLTLDMLNQS